LIARCHPVLIVGRRQWFQGTPPAIEAPTDIEFFQYDAPLSKDRSADLGASTFVVERRNFEDVGRWTPGIFHLDLQDLYMKLGYAGRMVLIVEPSTAYYRIHSGNSIHTVPPFLESLHLLMRKERSGQYAGGSRHRLARRAWLGGLAFYWIKRAVAAGLYGQAVKLAVFSSPFITAAILRRSAAWIRGRQPVQTLAFDGH